MAENKPTVATDTPPGEVKEKSFWDYHEEIEALKAQRAQVWRAALGDPYEADPPDEHKEMLRAGALRSMRADGTDTTLLSDQAAEDELARRQQIVYASFLARQAEAHPDVLAIDSKIRELRMMQLAIHEEPGAEESDAYHAARAEKE